MDADAPLLKLRQELHALSSEVARQAAQRFHKEAIKAYGVTVPQLRVLTRRLIGQNKGWTKQDCFALCEELWRSGYSEEAFIATECVYSVRKQFVEADVALFESWIARYVSNWAICDNFCNNSVGAIFMLYPNRLDDLKRWATCENRWLQRASAVSLIVPARKGMWLEVVFQQADLLMDSEDDLVQKGYGWLLKVASKSHPKEVFKYLLLRKKNMPRTALRYAIEHLATELKQEIMQS